MTPPFEYGTYEPQAEQETTPLYADMTKKTQRGFTTSYYLTMIAQEKERQAVCDSGRELNWEQKAQVLTAEFDNIAK